MSGFSVLDMPDEPEKVPGWLDRALVSPDLAGLVGELRAVKGDPKQKASLGQLLGARRGDVLARGLAALDRAQIAALLAQPRLLYGLRDDVVEHGGPYWSKMAAADPDNRRATEATVARVMRAIKGGGGTVPPPRDNPRVFSLSGLASTFFAVAAAIVLVLFTDIIEPRPLNAGPNMVREINATPDGEIVAFDRLRRVFAARAKSFDPTPEAVNSRLTDLIDGCDVLKDKPFPKIDQGKVADLRKKCVDWRDQFAKMRDGLPNEAPAVAKRMTDLAEKAAKAFQVMAADAKAG